MNLIFSVNYPSKVEETHKNLLKWVKVSQKQTQIVCKASLKMQ